MDRLGLIILCVFLMVTSRPGHAYPDLGLGVGYTNDCETIHKMRDDNTYSYSCRRGPRAEVNLDLFGRDYSSGPSSGGDVAASSSKRERSRSGGGGSWTGLWSGPSGGKGAEIFAVIVLVILISLVAYGLIIGIASLFSMQRSFGFYYAEDFFPKSDGTAEEPVPGSVRRWGLQLSFFLSESVPFRIHMGTGPASFSSPGRSHRDGFSSKIGLGFAPRPSESGFYLTAEAEYLTVYARTFKDLVKNSLPSKEPEYRATSSGLLGYKFAL